MSASKELQAAIGPNQKGHRALRAIVWAGRAVGWILIALAVLNAMSLGPFGSTLGGGFRLLASLALALLGAAWIVGLEIFLRFFDRYLSRN